MCAPASWPWTLNRAVYFPWKANRPRGPSLSRKQCAPPEGVWGSIPLPSSARMPRVRRPRRDFLLVLVEIPGAGLRSRPSQVRFLAGRRLRLTDFRRERPKLADRVRLPAKTRDFATVRPHRAYTHSEGAHEGTGASRGSDTHPSPKRTTLESLGRSANVLTRDAPSKRAYTQRQQPVTLLGSIPKTTLDSLGHPTFVSVV